MKERGRDRLREKEGKRKRKMTNLPGTGESRNTNLELQ